MSLVQAVNSHISTAGTTQTTASISTTAKNCLTFFAVYNATSAGVVTPSDSTGLVWVLEATYTGGASGLTLGMWVARNITGNAANTFTFVTTGADTPSIIVVENNGRDLFVPFDGYISASDTVSASGAHTTGTINARGGDDLLAFNVSSSLSQAYTATGLWAIPPNGTVTTSAGYDAFVQYINGANNGNNANTYSVAVADKLDAFIVALKPPALVASDEWLDYFNEVPEVFGFPSSVQQYDVVPYFNEIDQDWLDEAGDDDAWARVEDQSAPVVANNVTGSAAQYFGEDAELLDEVLNLDPTTGGYQQADNTPPLGSYGLDEPWDWFQEIDDDEWVTRDESNVQNPNVVATVSQPEETYWEDEDPDDFFADDFGNDDADLPQNDVWDHWPTDEDDYAVEDSYVLVDFNPALLFLNAEDPWDHFTTDDDDWAAGDDFINTPNPLLSAEDPTWWDEEPDQDDGTAHDLDPVGTDNNPVLCVEDAYDHFVTDDDDYVVIDDYALVDVAPNATITVEDAFDQFATDDDDYFIVDEFALITLVVAPAQPPEDAYDHFITDDDDYAVPDDVQLVDVAPSLQAPVEDGWTEHCPTDDDDYVVTDDFASVNNAPATVEDAWDHFVTDPDDELYQALDADQVSVPQPQPPEDGWDHFVTDPDDELYQVLDPNAVEPFIALSSQTDGWDHFVTDDDDWVAGDDYAMVDAVVAPSQFTDDAYDWFYEPAEDNEMDFAVEAMALPSNVYVSDPNFEVYMPQRNWVAMWLPTGIGTI
jgi:hypothetical protein